MATTDTTRFICLFHDASRSRAVLQALANAGISRESVSVIGNDSDSNQDYANSSLDALGAPDRDLKHLQEGLKRGGVIVALNAPEDRSGEIERIFHKFSADKIDQADLEVAPYAETAQVDTAATDTADSVAIPVVAEDLVVGKREVDRGGVRVFRRVVEEPVSQDVSLHEEHVVVERRPANRDVRDADFASGDQVIELTETAEVPVVAKSAHVVEEVRVGLQESDHTETVHDTVRHTEVDVEPIEGTKTTDRTNSRF